MSREAEDLCTRFSSSRTPLWTFIFHGRDIWVRRKSRGRSSVLRRAPSAVHPHLSSRDAVSIVSAIFHFGESSRNVNLSSRVWIPPMTAFSTLSLQVEEDSSRFRGPSERQSARPEQAPHRLRDRSDRSLGPEEQNGRDEMELGGAAAVHFVAPRGKAVHIEPHGWLADHMERQVRPEAGQRQFSAR